MLKILFFVNSSAKANLETLLLRPIDGADLVIFQFFRIRSSGADYHMPHMICPFTDQL